MRVKKAVSPVVWIGPDFSRLQNPLPRRCVPSLTSSPSTVPWKRRLPQGSSRSSLCPGQGRALEDDLDIAFS